ncbi:phosphate ABC transporter permease PstA [Nostocoides sp. F2B08]|uniref:phosphate ABC transporter permease PstA n=1 Tax=Nostocoides sp. F2B08 TaxID=2653936 RepID=UPI001263CBEF|nr:phosphate ABC transporter permease PstA [Tetrasphaera sp. F2B08]KAB7745106.1 phosphate ABC transporter permease PstA [Tetrasphaera sp. F2B08]
MTTTQTRPARKPLPPRPLFDDDSSGIKSGRITRVQHVGIVVGSAVAAALLLTAFSVLGPFALFVTTALVYLLGVYGVARAVEGRRHATDRVVTGLVTTFFLIALAPLVSVVWTVVSRGLARFDVEFFTWSMRGVLGEGGGAYHAIMGTLIITGITTLLSVPIGIFAAIYLVEYGGRGRLARALTFFVDVMTGIPSIVAGLFAVALFTLFLGPGIRMGIIGSVALMVLMIPVVVRSTEEMLRLVPNELREASYALGVPKWLTISKVVLPTAAAGIATGVTLAIARVIGETAPLLVTVGTTTGLNINPFEGRMQTLPVFAYYSYATPGIPREAFIERMWASVLTLILIVMTLNIVARLISKFFAPKTGR